MCINCSIYAPISKEFATYLNLKQEWLAKSSKVKIKKDIKICDHSVLNSKTYSYFEYDDFSRMKCTIVDTKESFYLYKATITAIAKIPEKWNCDGDLSLFTNVIYEGEDMSGKNLEKTKLRYKRFWASHPKDF